MNMLSSPLIDDLTLLLNAPFRYPAVWLPSAFLMGACIGSLLNVCILRLPAGRSLLWPGSTCGACFQRIQWRDNIPLISYWLLRGRCRYCGTGFSSRYFWIELLTALAFGGLWCGEVVFNVRAVGTMPNPPYTVPNYTDLAAIWLYHVCLVSILIAVVGITMHGAAVPRGLYQVGIGMGLLGAALAPWPWPVNAVPSYVATPVTFLGRVRGFFQEYVLIPAGLQPWPLWWWKGGDAVEAWRGLATAWAGATFGVGLMWLQSRLFSRDAQWSAFLQAQAPLRVAAKQTDAETDSDLAVVAPARSEENVLLLLMIGTFIGWQGVLLLFVLAIFLKVAQGIGDLVSRRVAALPFCLLFALATVVVLVCSGQFSIAVFQWLH